MRCYGHSPDNTVADDAAAMTPKILHLKLHYRSNGPNVSLAAGRADLLQGFKQTAPNTEAHLAGILQSSLYSFSDADGLDVAGSTLAIAGNDEVANRSSAGSISRPIVRQASQ